MSWSFSLGKFAGSEVRIHVTFLMLLAFIGIAQFLAGGLEQAVETVALVIAVFACVVAHEFGHALAARRYGIETPDITLLPIGGLARLSRIPENPTEEIVIAIAGPMVNVVIAAILYLILGAQFDPMAVAEIENPEPGFLVQLAAVNLFLVIFNLIPAFPMDGGRVLRAALTYGMGRRRATEIASRIGQGLAFVFGFVGLMSGNAILVFIAIFVFLAASGEAGEVSMRAAVRNVTVDRAMVRQFETLGTQATVDEAADALIRTTQREFPVVDGGGRLRGFLDRDGMIRSMKDTGAHTPVIEVMRRDGPTIRCGDSLDKAVKLMQEQMAPEIGVLDGEDRLVGYVSRENLAEFIMIEEADRPDDEASSTPWGGNRPA